MIVPSIWTSSARRMSPTRLRNRSLNVQDAPLEPVETFALSTLQSAGIPGLRTLQYGVSGSLRLSGSIGPLRPGRYARQ